MTTIEQIDSAATVAAGASKMRCVNGALPWTGPAHAQGDILLADACRIREIFEAPIGSPTGDPIATGRVTVATGADGGGRHVAEGDVRAWPATGHPLHRLHLLVGPGGAVVTHPEHAHRHLPEGIYICTLQMDLLTRQQARD